MSSGKKRKQQGVSGNPQRRAGQPRAGAPRTEPEPPSPAAAAPPRDAGQLRELAYRMAGGAAPAPWWRASHDRVLDRARAQEWPSGPAAAENLACDIVGGALFDCFERYREGHSPSQWLVTLTERTGAALRESVTSGDDDWRRLWPLLWGIAVTAPDDPAAAPGDSGRLARRMFPDITFPRETALAEIARIKPLFAERSVHPPIPSPASGPRADGPPLLARDEYGSRFLLAAPFGYAGGGDAAEAGHWYAWDVDACWIDRVTGMGTFGSAREALRAWRDAAGPAAGDARLAACGPDMTARLLRQSLDTGAFSDLRHGGEPRELFVEYYRERRRARELSESLGSPAGDGFTVDLDKAREEFLAWRAGRPGSSGTAASGTSSSGTGSASSDMGEAVDAITDQWGPHKDIDEAAFYACSPHRVETAAHLLRHGTNRRHAAAAIGLLPEWTQWCVERSGLAAPAAARSRGAALTAAAAGFDASAAIGTPAGGPFRRAE